MRSSRKTQLKTPIQYDGQGSGYNSTPTMNKSPDVTKTESTDSTVQKRKKEKETTCGNRQNDDTTYT